MKAGVDLATFNDERALYGFGEGLASDMLTAGMIDK